VDINAGDLSLVPAFHLRGKVILGDGKPMPPGMRIFVGSDRAFDTRSGVLASDGTFEISGLAKSDYRVFLSVQGYRLKSSQNGDMPVSIASDVADFVMTLDPR
jgi:hypothetical protein